MKKQTLWRVRYMAKVGGLPLPIGNTELLIADTFDDALRLARALPGSCEVQAVEDYGWCWA